MKGKRWILGLVLVAAVGLFGLMEAGASPFSSRVLLDDLGNLVYGTPLEAGDLDGSGNDDTGKGNGNDNSGSGNNSGHGNNADGVDSSNKGNSGKDDASCDGSGECVDDESGGGSKGKGKKK